MLRSGRHCAVLGVALLLTGTSVQAQDAWVGRTAHTMVGHVGQRQTREEVVGSAQPLARVSSRIQNRVQLRVRNRIDQYYDPQTNAASPFVVAGVDRRGKGTPVAG